MKCKNCDALGLGFFASRPDDYVCLASSAPFVIEDIEAECTEYPERGGVVKTIEQVAAERDAAIADLKSVINSSDFCACTLCAHNKVCNPDTCVYFESGVGMIDITDGTVHHDWKWDCRDFNFGDCAALENTPCHDCVTKDGCVNWKWRGIK